MEGGKGNAYDGEKEKKGRQRRRKYWEKAYVKEEVKKNINHRSIFIYGDG